GDYLGLGYGGDKVYPCYLSSQNGDTDVFTHVIEVGAEPRPAACCFNNGDCENLMRRDCIARGGDFKGKGVPCRLVYPCGFIKDVKTECTAAGTIKVQVKFMTKSKSGRTVKIGIGEELRYEINITGKKAKLIVCCFKGPQVVSLLDPEGCVEPQVVNCP
ncbi:unnamed protein product, partial [marine sediment metagenome]